ncbi:MAG: DUF3047 domain-containing protein [Gammaproteobacteria bacterium]|nr:DUF3047 domain-containing protein [Gammaproteobacteria bacterium]
MAALPTEFSPGALEDALGAALAALPPGLVQRATWLDLPSNRAPWTATGLELTADAAVTWFAAGASEVAPLPGLRFRAGLQIWARVGASEVFRGTRASHSFRAPAAGGLAFASYFPGEWVDRMGHSSVPAEAYAMMKGGFRILVVEWAAGVTPVEGVRALAATGRGGSPVTAELERLERPVSPPPGWEYLWYLGPAEIYSSVGPGAAAIACHTRDDVGILHYDTPLPFLPGTRLDWSWCIEMLPSKIAEDTMPTHDYLSIAVEFDNGQDLTYFWSAELPVGKVFRCPLPNWAQRETHQVVRSGTAELGRWFDESQDLYADYANALGTPPGHILRVWLIAVSIFQRGEGKAAYRGIRLANGAGEHRLA